MAQIQQWHVRQYTWTREHTRFPSDQQHHSDLKRGISLHLQQTAVYRARATLEGLLGVHERVFGVEGRGLMRLRMLGAVGGGAGEAGSDGRLFHTRTDVTPHHFLPLRCRHKRVGADRLHRVRLKLCPAPWRRCWCR